MGIRLACTGIRGEASGELAQLADHFQWAGPAQLGKIIRFFKANHISEVIMAGKIHKANIMHKPWKIFTLLPDLRTIRFWFSRNRKDNKDDSILLGIVNEFQRDGIHIGSALDYCPEILVREGTLSKRSPSSLEWEDIRFGWRLAREMGRLDVGQSVAVKSKAVLAVEAIEGTDLNIQRAGEFCRAGGFVVVKVAKPNQDRRFDVPTVGSSTIRGLHAAGGKVLAVEAGQTIILEEEETIQLANQLGITLISLTDSHIQAA